MNTDTLTWWGVLCLVSACNVVAWAVSGLAVRRRLAVGHADALAVGRLQLLLSAGYVFGCAYRSALPVFDVPRLCLVDSWFSSVIVGRSVATVAELCFAAQWAVLLRESSRAAGSGIGRAVAGAVVPMIAVAEICSWYSVLTTSNLGHVLEESIWGTSAVLLAISLFAVGRRSEPPVRNLFALLAAAGIAYTCYMFAVDVPMYWSRWVADETQGRHYMDLAQGLVDASTRWTVSYRWSDWQTEVVWMSVYFSAAVWISIGLIHAPVFSPARRRAAPMQLALR